MALIDLAAGAANIFNPVTLASDMSYLATPFVGLSNWMLNPNSNTPAAVPNAGLTLSDRGANLLIGTGIPQLINSKDYGKAVTVPTDWQGNATTPSVPTGSPASPSTPDQMSVLGAWTPDQAISGGWTKYTTDVSSYFANTADAMAGQANAPNYWPWVIGAGAVIGILVLAKR